MAAFIKFDGIDGEYPPAQADTQPNPPSWGLDRIDQPNLPGDFLAAASDAQATGYVRLQIMLAPLGEPEPNVDYTLTVTDTQTESVRLDPGPAKPADPFLAYGEGHEEGFGMSLVYKVDVDAPADGLIVIVQPVLDPAAIGLMRAEFIYG